MEKIAYNKNTGIIYGSIPVDQDVMVYYTHYSQEFKDSLGWLEGSLDDYVNCKIVDNQKTLMSDLEINELDYYGRFLSQEERLLESMKPSHEEIQKAEETLRLLELLQEVMV